MNIQHIIWVHKRRPREALYASREPVDQIQDAKKNGYIIDTSYRNAPLYKKPRAQPQ